jgi:prolyl-tRNA editing enzyme YbaK/EbsC (Cys-tRNA(Pro) deacylase)
MNGSREASIEESVRAALERANARYEVLPCDPALADTAAFCAHYGVPPGKSANTILVASRKEPKSYAVCLVLATTKLDVNRKVAQLLGIKKLSFASGEETMTVTGMMIGGVTPFGLPDELPIYVDSRILALDQVVVGGGSRSCKLRIAPEVFTRVPNARVVEGLGLERDVSEGPAQAAPEDVRLT